MIQKIWTDAAGITTCQQNCREEDSPLLVNRPEEGQTPCKYWCGELGYQCVEDKYVETADSVGYWCQYGTITKMSECYFRKYDVASILQQCLTLYVWIIISIPVVSQNRSLFRKWLYILRCIWCEVLALDEIWPTATVKSLGFALGSRDSSVADFQPKLPIKLKNDVSDLQINTRKRCVISNQSHGDEIFASSKIVFKPYDESISGPEISKWQNLKAFQP